MLDDAKNWFLSLSPRDQLALGICSVVLVCYVLIFVILLPMQTDLEKAEHRNKRALEEQQEVRTLAGRILAAKASESSQGGRGGLNAILNDSLREFGITMENFQPSGTTGARVRLAPSEFNKVLAWLNEMEIKRGVTIKDVTMTAQENPGTVAVTLQMQLGEQ